MRGQHTHATPLLPRDAAMQQASLTRTSLTFRPQTLYATQPSVRLFGVIKVPLLSLRSEPPGTGRLHRTRPRDVLTTDDGVAEQRDEQRETSEMGIEYGVPGIPPRNSPEFRCDEFRSAVRVFAPNPKHPNRQTAAEALPLTAERMSATVRRNLDWHSGMPRLWPASVNEGVRPRRKDFEFLKEVRK